MKYFRYEIVISPNDTIDRFKATGIIAGRDWVEVMQILENHYQDELERVLDLSLVGVSLYEEELTSI